MNPLPRRPLAGIALAFIAGTGLGLATPLTPLIPFGVALGALALATLFDMHHRRQARPQGVLAAPCVAVTILLHVASLAVGWANARLERMTDEGGSIADVMQLPAPGAELIGVVADTPISTRCKNGRLQWKFPLAAEKVRRHRWRAWQPVKGSVSVRLYTSVGERVPGYGERWALGGFLGQTLYRQGLLKGRPAGHYLAAGGARSVFITEGQGNRWIARCLAIRSWAAARLSHGIEDNPQAVGTLHSLLLGFRSQVPRELYQAYASTGTLHVLAISGSHVVILAGALIYALAACGLSRTRWILALAPLLVLYTVMTGLQPSAVRACLMGIAYWSAPLFGRKPDVYTALAAAAILILAVVPGDLLNIGFILSFVAVLGLALYCPIFTAPFRQCFRRDPLRLTPDTPWEARGRAVWRAIGDLIALTAAAWLVTAPLTALFFGTLSPVGLVGNLLAVPLASLIIVTGALSLAAGTVAAVFADLFNHANLGLAVALTRSIEGFAAIPYGCLPVGTPPPWIPALFYAVLLAWRFRLWVIQPAPVSAAGDAARVPEGQWETL
jgi:ComEC/Rec2-related protein